MIQKQKRRSEKEKSNINRKWARLLLRKSETLSDLLADYVSLYGKENGHYPLYEGNVGLIRNYIEPMISSVKLSEINTRFMERYYQGVLQTKAVGNPVKGNRKMNLFLRVPCREIHKLLRNCFE